MKTNDAWAPPWGLFEWTNTGWSAHGANVATTGHGDGLAEFAERAPVGCWVMDKRVDVGEHPEFVRLVLDAPLVDAALPPRDVQPFGDLRESRLAQTFTDIEALGVGNAYTALAAHAVADKTWSGLDKVGVDLFVDYWRTTRLVRVGRVIQVGSESVDGRVAVAWEDGATELVEDVRPRPLP